ncbi:MAG TPA: hypothetical protein VKU84_03950 [Stellaceae bacterium]|nr:hypothetical protein [Stellaceae bacterium]
MKGPLQALVAVMLAGAAAFVALRVRERRRALNAGPPEPERDSVLGEPQGAEVGSTGGMPEAG